MCVELSGINMNELQDKSLPNVVKDVVLVPNYKENINFHDDIELPPLLIS